jgi:hypothetical protein
MTKDNIATVTLNLFNILEPLSPEDRKKVIGAVMTLFGEQAPADVSEGSNGDDDSSGDDTKDAMSFFNEKKPKTKGENLAVAARYRERTMNKHEHTKEDFKKVIKSARRNFDDNNFNRDLDNAKVKGLFNKGKPITLSYTGQEYVDALPDKVAANKILKSTGTKRKKTVNKKKANKKK